MADIPGIGNFEDSLVLSQHVELLISSSSPGTTANDKFTAMRSWDLDFDHPESRMNHGDRRSYGYGTPDIGLNFMLSVTKDIVDYLRLRGTRVGRNLPIYTYAIKMTSNDGTSKTITLKGQLPRKKYIKPDVDQGTSARVECFVRILDLIEPVAT